MGTESSRDLVESTIRRLNADDSLSRDQIKPAFASLTIGSGSAAIVLADRRLSRTATACSAGSSAPTPNSAIFAKAGKSRPPAAICRP